MGGWKLDEPGESALAPSDGLGRSGKTVWPYISVDCPLLRLPLGSRTQVHDNKCLFTSEIRRHI